MRIAIVGCGRMGTALAVALSRRQVPVTVTARRPCRADELASRLSGVRAGDLATAAAGATAVVLAVPAAAAVQLAGRLRPVAAGRTVLDLTNPNHGRPLLPAGPPYSTAEELARLLPDSPVAKAFNTVPASLLPHPVFGAVPITVPIATDSAVAYGAAAGLAGALGFEPVSAGPLRNGVLLEQLAGVLHLLGTESGHGARVGFHLARAGATRSGTMAG